MIPEYVTGLMNNFKIAGTLQRLNLNKSGSRKWITKVEVNNAKILILKMICLYYSLSGQLAI